MKKISLLIIFFLFTSFAFASSTVDSSAEKRAMGFEKLISDNQDKSILNKLVAVNDFFNQISYKEDNRNWGKNDYWAKPKEFLNKGAGDCEDYALAKLYALNKLGIPQNKFKLIYSKIKKNEKPHMVLAYYYNPEKEPLILDNFNKKIFLKNKRNDLEYIYAFNTIMLNK